MDNKQYFQQLVKLYEAASAANVEQHQANIADTGNDVQDENVDSEQPQEAQEQQEENPEVSPQEQAQEDGSEINGLNDADYLNNPSAQDGQPVTSENPGKKLELFDLFKNLLNYSELFIDTLDSVELGLLDSADVLKANKLKDSLVKLTDKIKFYLEKTFSTEIYEKTLYAYILFRTELLTAIKNLRDVLKLNEVDDEQKL